MDSDGEDMPLNLMQDRLHHQNDASQDTDHTDGQARPSNGSDETFDADLPPHRSSDQHSNEDDEINDDDDDDDDDDDEMELELEPSGDEVEPHVEARDDANGRNPVEDENEEDDDDEDDEDDVPLSTRVPSFSRLKKHRRPPAEAPPLPESDSDDDIPLASRLKKTAPKVMRRAPVPRKKRSSKKDADTVRPRKVTKRAPRVKKDDDAPVRKFEKAGQRRETPPDNDPSRLFYQSMYKEKVSLGKSSQLADTWMLRHGLVEEDDGERIMNRWDLKH